MLVMLKMRSSTTDKKILYRVQLYIEIVGLPETNNENLKGKVIKLVKHLEPIEEAELDVCYRTNSKY